MRSKGCDRVWTEADAVEKATREGFSFSELVSSKDKQPSAIRGKSNALGRPLPSSL